MRLIERFEASPRGPLTEDLIIETPDYFGLFDGVTGVRAGWSHKGLSMGQWAAQLAGEALSDLPAGATIRDYAGLAARRLLAARHEAGLDRADRLATSVIILPRRRPLEVWVIGDSHFGYKTAGGEWTACPQGKLYDDITGGMRRIVVQQEIMAMAAPPDDAACGAIAVKARNALFSVLDKQMLFANHPDPAEKLGFGVMNGTPVPDHLLGRHILPDDTVEVVLCSDGIPLPVGSADGARALLAECRESDPFMIGLNRYGVSSSKGYIQPDGSRAAYYDDVSYLRVAV
jgi:hypothetical protein